MENIGDIWHRETAARIGKAVADRRKALGMTAQQLAERCADLDVPIHRTTITKIENGRPRFDLGELVVLASALDVAPVALIYPDLPDGLVERLPGDTGASAAAVWWFTGEHDETAGDLGRLLWLTRYRYAKREQALKAGELLDRIRHSGGELSTDDRKLIIDLLDEVRKINDLMREIPGSVVDNDA